ncbi:MAG: crotonase [Deltaproteobacteria bacterium]|nr:crotonase [Deltaproteobacteria bacterium]
MDYVSLTVENHVGTVVLNKPPVNSFNLQMYREIENTFHSINDMDNVWVVILKAEGKSFSTGNDVNDFMTITTAEHAENYARHVSDSIVSIYECPVPVIGALHGKVLGAGLAMASCCDILVATEDAMFGLPEIIVGIVGAGCFLSRLLPQQLARYMAYSGEMMTAEQMKKFGALLKIVPVDGLWEAAKDAASRLVKNPPLALRGFKAAMNRNENARLKEKYAIEIGYGKGLIGTADFKEAVGAFLEKRKPLFKGR